MLLKGNISTMSKNINGIIILLSFRVDFEKYFLKKEMCKTLYNKIKTIAKPNAPNSVKISK